MLVGDEDLAYELKILTVTYESAEWFPARSDGPHGAWLFVPP